MLFIASVCAFGSLAHGQETWSSAASPTTQDLWGITWSGTQFVAVGNGGVICTSPDGRQWTTRTAGTSEWLLAVTYAADRGLYVVVGDHGTILTSTDGITWLPQRSGTTQRLNGVAYGGGTFVAVGENGTVVSSPAGSSWYATTLSNAGWLRAIAYIDGHFIFGGQKLMASGATATDHGTVDGRTFESLPDLVIGADREAFATDAHVLLWVAGDIAISPAAYPPVYRSRYLASAMFNGLGVHFRGAALFNNAWLAAGSQGTIIYGPETLTGWSKAVTDVTADLFAAAANATVAVAVGAGGTIVTSTPAQHAPTAAWTDVNQPTLFSATTGTDVTFSTGSSGTAPLTYQWTVNGQAIPGATDATLALHNVQPGHSGAYAVTVANALGATSTSAHSLVIVSPLAIGPTVDPSFKPSLAAAPMAYTVQPDGKVIVYGSFTLAAGTFRGVVRLLSDGTVDGSFTPVPLTGTASLESRADGMILLSGEFQLPPSAGDLRFAGISGNGSVLFRTLATVAPANSGHVWLPDNRIIVFGESNNVLSLQRLTDNGALDSSYGTQVLALSPTNGPEHAVYENPYVRWTPSGQPLVVTVSSTSGTTGIFGVNRTKVIPLNSDGTVTESNVLTLPVAAIDLVSTGTAFYYIAPDSTALGSILLRTLGRASATGVLDSSYPTRTWSGSASAPLPVFALLSDGSAIWPGHYGNLRIDPDGKPDPEFSGDDVPITTTGFASLPRDQWYAFRWITTPTGIAQWRRVTFPATSATRLANVSVRQVVSDGGDPMIVGFAVAGAGTRDVLTRAAGPALRAFGLTDALPDPQFTLVDRAGLERAANDNWSTATNAAAMVQAGAAVGAFPFADGSRDAAALTTLETGTYSFHVSGSGNGVVLAEAYDVSPTPASYAAARVVNFSARAVSQPGSGVLTAGFSVVGPGTRRLLIRAVGPSLGAFGVANVLTDPVCTLYHEGMVVAWNNDVNNDEAMAAATTESGAFPLQNSKEAAFIVTLPPGVYSAQVTSADGSSGNALVEVYELRANAPY